MEKLFWAYSPFPSAVVEMLKSKPMDDERHEVSDNMVMRLEKVAYAQDDFGMKKYNKPLHADMNYDWLEMAREEFVDMGKYLECEAERKEKVLGLLELAMVTRNWRTIEHAYAELGKKGTGKEKTAK